MSIEEPEAGGGLRLNRLESRVFMALVLATTAVFLWMIRYFIAPLFWAVVFAILFQPVYVRTREAVRGRAALAAFLTTLVVILFVAIPATLLVTAVAQQGLTVYQRVVDGELNVDAPIEFGQRMLPTLTSLFERYGLDIERLRTWMESAAVTGSQWIATQALTIGQNTLTVAVLFILMLYVLFFFFRDGDLIVRGLIRALPMGDEREERLFHRFAEVARATVQGTLVVAAVQGTLGGILLAVGGIQAAVFWGVLMGILSLLPAVGPALVWLPAGIYLLASGMIVQGIIVIGGGLIIVSLADNVLRPILVGRQARMPDYLVLIATLGGLTAFGIAGFVAGPVIAALFLVMWEMFAEEYAPYDSSKPLAAGLVGDGGTVEPVGDAEPAVADEVADVEDGEDEG